MAAEVTPEPATFEEMARHRLVEEWELQLDQLHLETLRIERAVRAIEGLPARPWQPPEMSGSLSAELLDRATELLARQRAAHGALTRLLDQARQEAAFADRVAEHTATARRPVYLDLRA